VDAAVLIEEATRKSGVVWVVPDGGARAYPVWHVWHDGSMYVVTGGLEQACPMTARANVVVRSKERQGDVVVEWVATVHAVDPQSPLWAEVVPVLHGHRLNARDGEGQPARWARESTVLRFRPTGDTVR
jgi:hypothetical protein